MRSQFELVADCPACHVDGTVRELYDPSEPACAFGLPADARCRLCEARWCAVITEGASSRGVSLRGPGRCPCCANTLNDNDLAAHGCSACGSIATPKATAPPLTLATAEALTPRLQSLADDEGTSDIEALLAEAFAGLTVDDLAARIARGERTETALDTLVSLFQRGPGRGGATVSVRRTPPQRVGPPATPATVHEPRAMLLALVSVLAADGQRDPREVAFVDGFLVAEGLQPLRPDEVRVHRPMEIARRIPPARRAEVVELMTQLACIDGVADPSEVRLVMSYASAWGIPEDQVSIWIEMYRARYASSARRFVARIRSFFVARETDHELEEGLVSR